MAAVAAACASVLAAVPAQAAEQHAYAAAYSYALDQQPGTLPATAAPAPTARSASVALPNGAADGLWYFHLRVQHPADLAQDRRKCRETGSRAR